MEPQRNLRDDAERSLRADEKSGEIVAGGGLPGPARRANDLPRRKHDLEPQHIRAHRTVTYCVGTRRTRRGHTAKTCVSTRIDRKKKPGMTEFLIELLAGYPGLYPAIEVFLVDRQYAVHALQIQADPAMHRVHVTFQ